MTSHMLYDVMSQGYSDLKMSTSKDPDVLLLCEELENIVDDFMYMYKIDYSGNMVDLSHDSSSGIESGDAPVSIKRNDHLKAQGIAHHQLSEQEKTNNLTENILRQNGVVFSNPHRRDPSWTSTCSDMDSDIRSGSIFSSSDTDTNSRYKNVHSVQATRSSPISGIKLCSQSGVEPKVQKSVRTFKSAPLKCKKHVTFQAANGMDPLNPVTGKGANQNGHYNDSNILYYEDDSGVVSEQYYQNQSELQSKNTDVRINRTSSGSASGLGKGQTRDKTHRINGRGGKSGAARLIQSFHRKQSSLGDDQSGYQGSEDDDATTDTSGELAISRDPIRNISARNTPSPRIPTATGQSDSDIERKQKPKQSHFEKLPDDVLVKIFSHLPSDQLCRCARVCRRWYFQAYNPSLWTCIRINSEITQVDKALKLLTRRLSYDTPTVCVMVEKIQLNCCENLTDKGLYTIAKRCPELRQLEMIGCPKVTNIALFELVSRCVNLEHLNTSGCENITCISLTPQATVQAQTYGKQVDLRYLDMSDCVNLEDSGLQIIASYCSQLVYLYLRRCVKVTDIGVQYVANYCSNLKEFSICDCKNVTDFGLKELSKLGSNLRYLSAAKCSRISDTGVKQIATHCHRLRYLNVRGCERISDDAIETLAKNCPRLRSLDIGKCDVTDDSLFALSEHCIQLRKLSLKACDAITDTGITSVAERCRSLQQLNIQECHLTVNAYRTVKTLCKRCIIEHTNPGFY